MSTPETPKQFHQIFDDRSLLQLTWERLRDVVPAESIYVATNDRHRAIVLQQLPVGEDRIIGEPARRNTAPAITTACAIIANDLPGATIGIFPSDHWIGDSTSFTRTVETAFEQAARSEALGTIAIEPTRPATGFGYLRLGEETTGARKVEEFIEKPSAEHAQRMLDTGGFAWNGGMFVWTWETFREAMARHAPQILSLAETIAATSDWSRYPEMDRISIDYVLMEKAEKVFAVAGDFGWSDLGTWDVIAATIPSDERSVRTVSSEGVFIKRASDKPLAILGLDNVAVVETEDGLLVLNLERADLMRKLSEDE